MDWNLLKIYLAIAETGSLAGAARRLGVNHSTVYRRLQMLENQLQGRVFERSANGYHPTPLGEELRDIANRIGTQFDELDRRIVGKDVQPRGPVKITAPNNIAYQYLPEYLTEFHHQYPDIQTEVLVSNTELNMNNRQAEVAVRATPAPPENLVGREVATIPWYLYGSDPLITRHGRPQSMEALTNLPLTGGAGGMLGLPAFQWLDQNLPHNIHFRSDDLVAMAELVLCGAAFAVLPADHRHPNLIPLLAFDQAPPSKLWVLTHPDLRKTARVRLLMGFLANKLMAEPFPRKKE